MFMDKRLYLFLAVFLICITGVYPANKVFYYRQHTMLSPTLVTASKGRISTFLGQLYEDFLQRNTTADLVAFLEIPPKKIRIQYRKLRQYMYQSKEISIWFKALIDHIGKDAVLELCNECFDSLLQCTSYSHRHNLYVLSQYVEFSTLKYLISNESEYLQKLLELLENNDVVYTFEKLKSEDVEWFLTKRKDKFLKILSCITQNQSWRFHLNDSSHGYSLLSLMVEKWPDLAVSEKLIICLNLLGVSYFDTIMQKIYQHSELAKMIVKKHPVACVNLLFEYIKNANGGNTYNIGLSAEEIMEYTEEKIENHSIGLLLQAIQSGSEDSYPMLFDNDWGEILAYMTPKTQSQLLGNSEELLQLNELKQSFSAIIADVAPSIVASFLETVYRLPSLKESMQTYFLQWCTLFLVMKQTNTIVYLPFLLDVSPELMTTLFEQEIERKKTDPSDILCLSTLWETLCQNTRFMENKSSWEGRLKIAISFMQYTKESPYDILKFLKIFLHANLGNPHFLSKLADTLIAEDIPFKFINLFCLQLNRIDQRLSEKFIESFLLDFIMKKDDKFCLFLKELYLVDSLQNEWFEVVCLHHSRFIHLYINFFLSDPSTLFRIFLEYIKLQELHSKNKEIMDSLLESFYLNIEEEKFAETNAILIIVKVLAEIECLKKIQPQVKEFFTHAPAHIQKMFFSRYHGHEVKVLSTFNITAISRSIQKNKHKYSYQGNTEDRKKNMLALMKDTRGIYEDTMLKEWGLLLLQYFQNRSHLLDQATYQALQESILWYCGWIEYQQGTFIAMSNFLLARADFINKHQGLILAALAHEVAHNLHPKSIPASVEEFFSDIAALSFLSDLQKQGLIPENSIDEMCKFLSYQSLHEIKRVYPEETECHTVARAQIQCLINAWQTKYAKQPLPWQQIFSVLSSILKEEKNQKLSVEEITHKIVDHLSELTFLREVLSPMQKVHQHINKSA